MTKHQLAITLTNLRKVSRELPELAKTKPTIITDFNMGLFGVFEDCTMVDMVENECETQGCLLGNSALLFNVSTDEELFDHGHNQVTFSYQLFGQKYFPALYTPGHRGDDFNATANWDFIFSGLWDEVQPTFEEAIERLDYVISELEQGNEITAWYYRSDLAEAIENVLTQPIVFKDEPEQA